MRLKSYFADTIEEAIGQARRELGPEAMLVNSKQSGAEARHLGMYEVVCAGETESVPAGAVEIKGRPAHPPISAGVDRLSQDVTELKQQMERLALSLARSGSGMSGIASDPELSNAFALLAEAEVDADLAYEAVGRMASPFTREALRSTLGGQLTVNSELGCGDAETRVVCLVGPPGAGKTTTLVKLAMQYGIPARRPAQILTLDTYRIAAADELQSYAAILGMGCQVVETTMALAQAIEQHREKDLILIDTPGLAGSEIEELEGMAYFLSRYPGMDTHLVLPASMRTSDLKRAAQRYEIFAPRKLLFTRLDETQTFGPILSLSIRTGKPVSFLCRGQRIPEDLEPAARETVLDLVMKAARADESKFGSAAA